MQQVSLEMTRINFSLARVYLTANQAISHNTATKVSGYTESSDIGDNFASDKYVAKATGYYQVNFSVYYYDATSKLNFAVSKLYKNGSEILNGVAWSGPDSAYIVCHGGDQIQINAGEYLELYGFILTSDSGAAVMLAGSANTFMSVHLIST